MRFFTFSGYAPVPEKEHLDVDSSSTTAECSDSNQNSRRWWIVAVSSLVILGVVNAMLLICTVTILRDDSVGGLLRKQEMNRDIKKTCSFCE